MQNFKSASEIRELLACEDVSETEVLEVFCPSVKMHSKHFRLWRNDDFENIYFPVELRLKTEILTIRTLREKYFNNKIVIYKPNGEPYWDLPSHKFPVRIALWYER